MTITDKDMLQKSLSHLLIYMYIYIFLISHRAPNKRGREETGRPQIKFYLSKLTPSSVKIGRICCLN